MDHTERRSPITALALGCLLVAAACDKKDVGEPDVSEKKEQPREEPLEPPEFDWEEAAQSSPKELEEELGSFQNECDADAPLEEVDSRRRVQLLTAPGGCRVADADDKEKRAYRVTRILYSEGRPAAIHLRPGGDVPMTESGLEPLGLPRLDAQRGHTVEGSARSVRVRSFRKERVGDDTEPRTLLGVDLVASEEGAETADRAVLYVQTEDGAGRRLAQWNGPPAVHRRLMLPASLHSTAVHANIAVEIGVDQVRVRHWDDYPVRGPASEDSPDPVEFALKAMGPDRDKSSWESDLGAFVEAFRPGKEVDGSSILEAMPTFGVAATQTAPVGRVEDLLVTLDDQLGELERSDSWGPFQLVVRAGDRVAPPFSPFPQRGGFRVRVRSGEPELRSRTGESFLNLRVKAGVEGFEIVAGGKELPPIKDCPDPGPTICPANRETNVRDSVERAVSLHRDGAFEEADAALNDALDRFDWTALHRNFRRIHDRYSDASRIYLSVDPGLPVAVVVRMMNLARFRLRPRGADDCSSDFSEEGAVGEAVPCMRPNGKPQTMFDRQFWQVE